jgi:hypothetical protein
MDLNAIISRHYGDATRVIAAVLELSQAIQQNRLSFPFSNITDDTAHNL